MGPLPVEGGENFQGKGSFETKRPSDIGKKANDSVEPSDRDRWSNICQNGGSAEIQIGDITKSCGSEASPSQRKNSSTKAIK